MKKIVLTTLVALCSSAAVSNAYTSSGAPRFSGFYFGGAGGFGLAKNKSSVSFKVKKTGGLFEVFAGHRWGFVNNWIFGLEGKLGADTAKSNTGEKFFKSYFTFKRKYYIDVSANMGVLLMRKLVLYGRAGFIMSGVRLAEIRRSEAKRLAKKTSTNPVLGLGLDFFVIENVFGRLEYSYSFKIGKGLHLKSASNQKVSVTRDIHALMLGVGLKF